MENLCRSSRYSYSRLFFLLDGYLTIFVFYTDFTNITLIDDLDQLVNLL